MPLIEDREFRLFVLTLGAFYVLSGLYGAAWISDEFDQVRGVVYGFVGIPAAVLFYGLVWFVPGWWRRFPKVMSALAALTVVVFAWGNALLANAVAPSEVALVNHAVSETGLVFAEERGPFGWLHTKRW